MGSRLVLKTIRISSNGVFVSRVIAAVFEARDRQPWSGPPDSLYEGGLFSAILQFPEDFPNNPPDMRFETPMWHPNVYPGKIQNRSECGHAIYPPRWPSLHIDSAPSRN